MVWTIVHEGTFTDIFKFLLIDDSETKKKILELAFKEAYSKEYAYEWLQMWGCYW